jgi:hypothetical protein
VAVPRTARYDGPQLNVIVSGTVDADPQCLTGAVSELALANMTSMRLLKKLSGSRRLMSSTVNWGLGAHSEVPPADAGVAL